MKSKTILIFLSVLIVSAGCGKKYKLHRDIINLSSDWAFYRGDLQASGAADNIGFQGKLDILWEFKSNDKPVGPLTMYNEFLIYPGGRNKIKFIAAETGHFKGYLKPKGTAQSGLIISDSLAFLANSAKKGNLKCINLLNRKTVWQKQVKDAAGGSIIIEEKLIVGSVEGSLFAFEKSTGNVLWTLQTKSSFALPPLFGSDRVWMAGADGVIYCIDAENGSEVYNVKLPNPVVASMAFDRALFVADIKGIVYKIDHHDGSILWQYDIGAPVWGAPAVKNNRLYIAHSGGDVLALSTIDGSELWRFKSIDVITAPVLVVGEFVLFGSKSSKFYSLRASDGSLVEKRELYGAVTAAPVTNGTNVYVATDKGMITCFGVNNESNSKE